MIVTDGIFTCVEDVYCKNSEKCFSIGKDYHFKINEIKGIILDWLVGINDNGHEHIVAMLENGKGWDFKFLNKYFRIKEVFSSNNNV